MHRILLDGASYDGNYHGWPGKDTPTDVLDPSLYQVESFESYVNGQRPAYVFRPLLEQDQLRFEGWLRDEMNPAWLRSEMEGGPGWCEKHVRTILDLHIQIVYIHSFFNPNFFSPVGIWHFCAC